MTEWTGRRIVRELADGDRRKAIMTAFWRHADPQAKALAMLNLGKAMHFREETLRGSGVQPDRILASIANVDELL